MRAPRLFTCFAVLALLGAGCENGGTAGPPDGGPIGDGGDNPNVPGPLELTEGDPLPAPTELLGTGQGLPNEVLDASFDLGGNLWVAHRDRLYVRRAGTGAFESFGEADGLKGDPILSVSGSSAGTAFVGYRGEYHDLNDPEWMRATGGAARVQLDGADIRHTHYRLESGPGVYPQYPDGRAMLRACFRTYATKTGRYVGEAWFGCNHGVGMVSNAYGVIEHQHPNICPWDPATQTCSVRVGDVPAIGFGPGDRMWFGGTYGVMAMDYDDGGAGNFWGPEPVRNEILWNNPISPNAQGSVDVSGIAVASDGTAWVASLHSGLVHRLADGTVEVYQESNGLPSNRIQDVAIDSEGGLWMATVNSGVVRLDLQTGVWRRASGLPSGLSRRVVAEPTPDGPAVVVTVRGGVAVYRAPFNP